MLRLSVSVLQLLLAITFIAIPISRIFGASTLQQVLSLGLPMWLIWVANVIELGGAVLLLLGLRMDLLAACGALLIAASMMGATLAHVRAGNLFAEVPWTLIILGMSLIVLLLRWSAVQVVLRGL
ncbi:MAG TPA: DoxX family protein [Ktedonosporobacter sp.]|nr:DoxX family protein [Ktedonosporobacter sp.]